MLLHVRQGFPTGQSYNAKSTPRSLNTTLSLEFRLQDAFLCLLKDKNSSKANVYEMTKTTCSTLFPLWEEEEKIKR